MINCTAALAASGGAVTQRSKTVQSTIALIRRTVPRPRTLPHYDEASRLRWSRRLLKRWASWDIPTPTLVCPLGLHRESSSPTPYESFACFSDKQVDEFVNWWDGLRCGPQTAMNLVWGPE